MMAYKKLTTSTVRETVKRLKRVICKCVVATYIASLKGNPMHLH